jgi:general secretion pathway protein H
MLMLLVGNKKVSSLSWLGGESNSKVFLQSFYLYPLLRKMENNSFDPTNIPSTKEKIRYGNGFTLLELIVVMAILVMAMALVIPHISSGEMTFLKAQVREVVAVLKYTRRSAIVEGKQKSATFYESREGTDDESTSHKKSTSQKTGQWVSRGATLEWSSKTDKEGEASETANYKITFYPEGGSSGGEFILTYLKFKAKISVNPITGQVKSEILYDEKED